MEKTAKRGLVLVQNKDERAMSRQSLKSFSTMSMFGNLQDGLEELKRHKGAFDLLVLDERFDLVVDHKHGDLRILDLLEAFMASPSRPDDAVVAVILNESSTLENPALYLERGVDIFLRRPFGMQELAEKLAEADRWIDSPPPLLRLMRTFEQQVREEKYAEAIAGLEPLYEKQNKSIRIGMLLARSLINAGPETRPRGIKIARTFDERFPNSLFTKRVLADAYRKQGQLREAFQIALKLHACNPNGETFLLAFDSAEALTPRDNSDLTPWMEFLVDLSRQPAAVSKEFRFNVVRHLADKKPDLAFITKVLKFFEADQQDLLPMVKDFVEGWVGQIFAVCQSSPTPELEALHAHGLKILLDIDPGRASAIEKFVDYQLKSENLKEAEFYLHRARERARYSVEFYSAFTKLALEQNMLKEASDYLHAGRRLSPKDERWDPLAKIWTDKYSRRREADPQATAIRDPGVNETAPAAAVPRVTIVRPKT